MLAKFLRNQEDGTFVAVVGLTEDEVLKLGSDPDKVLEFHAEMEGKTPIRIVLYAEVDEDALTNTFVNMFGSDLPEVKNN